MLATSLAPSKSKTLSRTPSGTSARCDGIFQKGRTGRELTISSNSAGSCSAPRRALPEAAAAALAAAPAAAAAAAAAPTGVGVAAKCTAGVAEGGAAVAVPGEVPAAGTDDGAPDLAAGGAAASALTSRTCGPFVPPLLATAAPRPSGGGCARRCARPSQAAAAAGRAFTNTWRARSKAAPSATSCSSSSSTRRRGTNAQRCARRVFAPAAGTSVVSAAPRHLHAASGSGSCAPSESASLSASLSLLSAFRFPPAVADCAVAAAGAVPAARAGAVADCCIIIPPKPGRNPAAPIIGACAWQGSTPAMPIMAAAVPFMPMACRKPSGPGIMPGAIPGIMPGTNPKGSCCAIIGCIPKCAAKAAGSGKVGGGGGGGGWKAPKARMAASCCSGS
mmetsp:Transcript_113069/g.330454  ORF Transcript_113069/g.330454 Transcript_113069/m.330454 type:complete len:391 (+) Transcript_113069:2292-3464(+)